MTGCTLRLPTVTITESATPANTKTSVTIEDAEFCPRYAARLIEGVIIGPSPAWLVKRLETVGMRSINNVVDVTNFVIVITSYSIHYTKLYDKLLSLIVT